MQSVSGRRQITRTAAIKKHVDAAIAQGYFTKERYAAEVVEHFNRTYPIAATRGIKPFADEIDGTPAHTVLDTNRKRIFRYLEDCIPANMEESYVAALPDSQRADCLRELAARYGLLPAPLPEGGKVRDHEELAAFMANTSASISSLVKILEDGVIDEADLPFAPEALSNLKKTLASGIGLIERIRVKVLGDDSYLSVVR